MWLSTTKYFSPSFSYTVPPRRAVNGWWRRGRLVRDGGEVEVDVLGGVFRVREHDRLVVQVDHPPVVRGHVLLELRGVEVAGFLAQGLGDLVVDDIHPADSVDPDHGRERRDRHIGLRTHDFRYNHADLIVHQRESAHVGSGVVGLVRAFRDLECGHWASSFGTSRCRSPTMTAKRFLAASRPSSNRGGLESGCDQSGCRMRAAVIARGTQVDSQPAMIVLFRSANSRSSLSS